MVSLLLVFITSGISIAIASLVNLLSTAIYAAIGAVLLTLYVTIDVQMLISGNRKIQLTSKDHFYTSLLIYFDIFYIIFFPFEK